jgi:hypothetical protein
MNRTQAYWSCQLGGWGLYGLLTTAVFGLRLGWDSHLFVNTATAILVGIGVTHTFRAFVQRAAWTELELGRLVPRILGACLVLSALYTGVNDLLVWAGIRTPIGFDEIGYWSVPRVAFSVFGSAIILLPWLVIYFGVHYFWNYRQAEVDKWKLEAQAETARLKALKLQLNPHFFFNSLNSVRALIAEDPERAQRMVTRLARLLRTTLQVDDVKTVPLKEELSTVRTYLELETVRFEERLQYEIDASEAALRRPVPFLLVQTLVENSIKHGIAERQGGGTITIDATVADDTLHLTVTNPGTLESEEGGVGLQNARERLQLLFGDEASLTLEQVPPDTVAATAVVPARDENERPGGQPAPQAAERIDA